MKLITSTDKYDCVAVSMAMLLGVSVAHVKSLVWPDPLEYPFPAPWDTLPKIPSMEVICEWMLFSHDIALVPFPHNPVCTPDVTRCPPVPVYDEDPDTVFNRQLELGPGLLEGVRARGSAHMCAWDGQAVFDPRGHIYSLNITHLHDFVPTRFWLAKKCN